MAILPVQTISADGLDASYVAAGVSGDRFRPSDRTFFHVKNGGGGSVTVTVDDNLTRTPAGATSFDPDLEVVIEPGGERFIGPIVATRFRATDGYADVTYDSVTSVTVAALRT